MGILKELVPDSDLLKRVSAAVAARWRFIPIGRAASGSITVAACDPDNLERLDNISVFLGAPVTALRCDESEFREALRKLYGLGAEAIDSLQATSVPSESDPEFDSPPESAAMVRFVDDLLKQAHRERATDIHIEPFENETTIRFRIDGLLNPIRVPENLVRHQALLTSRIKVMAHMNIAEKRLPQDGRVRVALGEDNVDIRVSTIPTVHGETVDLRLLPQANMIHGLEKLGLSVDQQTVLEKLIRKPNGIVLVTGPTGHGKTTTLYSFLSGINTSEKKIVTIEDPVEYRLRGINQIQVHAKIGLTFASGLRSVLRQDPDVIMVGEIRDHETAEIAIRASLTGHLVFSTLHTNDAIGAVTRLIDMGIEPYLVASSVSVVLAQRLVRTLCTACGHQKPECDICHGVGFKGRTGLFELLIINESLREMIASRTPASALRKAAASLGMKTLFESGQAKAERGITTLNEVRRVAEEIA